MGEPAQLVDRRCAVLLGAVGDQIIDAPESLDVLEDGLYTSARWHGHGPPRLAHKSWRGFVVQALLLLPMFVLICLAVRRRE